MTKIESWLQLERAATSYCVEVDRDQFARLLKFEQTRYMAQSLLDELKPVDGVSGIEYDGHFGPFIYLTIESEYDTPERQAEVVAIISRRLRATHKSR